MALYGDSRKALAEALDIRRETLSNKIRGKTIWTTDEISIMAARYDLTGDEIKEIFLEEVKG